MYRIYPEGMSDVTDFRRLVREAALALADNDASTALRKARAARALYPAIPDGQRDGTGVTWDRQTLNEVIRDANAMVAASKHANGLQTSKVEWAGRGD